MRKPLHLLAMLIAVVAIGALTATGYAMSTSAKPSLKLISWHPLTLQGQHFKPHAHVTVTLVWTTDRIKHVTVNRQGRFKVTFTTSPLNSCTQWWVRAKQPGRMAVVYRGPRPVCPPA